MSAYAKLAGVEDWRLVALADERVSIFGVAQQAGVDVPERVDARSVKVLCPFGELYHRDGGHEPAMRIYSETNSAWCFACSAYYSPVRLHAQAHDLSLTVAAQQLLDRIGFVDTTGGPDAMERAWAVFADYEPAVDVASLADALRVFCGRRARELGLDWEGLQVTAGPVAEGLARCLDLLQHVRKAEAADRWLVGTKRLMDELVTRTKTEAHSGA